MPAQEKGAVLGMVDVRNGMSRNVDLPARHPSSSMAWFRDLRVLSMTANKILLASCSISPRKRLSLNSSEELNGPEEVSHY